ncbi:hypothetical protein UMZ34_09790 [Halopseudomonas pachastrellae]|nr:hypothetical protein UMZ34_09790 [Halopseudomonas pachastrellae]
MAHQQKGAAQVNRHTLIEGLKVLQSDVGHRQNAGVVDDRGDRLVDLVAEGVDCVIRSGMPENSSLSAKPLALIPEVTCASRRICSALAVRSTRMR